MKSRRIALLSLAPVTLVAVLPLAANAATISWDGSASTAWATGANWTGDVAPANDLVSDVAQFNLAAYGNQPDAGTTSVAGVQVGDGTTVTGGLSLGGTALTIGTGGVSMLANAGAASINAAVTLGAAQTWTNNSANTLNAGSITPTSGSGTSVNFAGSGVIHTANANANGILGAWATTGMAGTNGAAGNWAAVDGSGNIVAYAGYTDITAATAGAGATAENWRTTNGASALTATATVNSLVMTQDFSVSSGATMTLGSGGMILSGVSKWLKNNGNGSIAGTGQITSGLASGELFIHSSGNPTADGDWRIWAKLVDNGGTAVKLVKSGPGFLDLQNANSYTGGTILNAGRLSASNNGALGSGSVVMRGGTLTIAKAGANITLANNITLSGSNSINSSQTRNLELTGIVTGSGLLTLGNDGTVTSVFLNATNSMTGGTIVMANSGNAQRIANTAFGNANVAWVLSNTVVNKTTLDFTDGTVSFGSMTGAGRIQGNNATGTKTISAGALGLNDTFSGIVSNGAGTVALTKTGSGTMILSGANAYTGATTVTGGTLQVGDGTAGSIAGTSAVDIGASGTLALNLASGATFANVIGGSGALQKTGAGTLTLSGASSGFSGSTAIQSGTLNVTGDITGSSVTLGAATLTGNGFVGSVNVTNAAAVIANGNANTATLQLDDLAFTTPGTVNANLVDQSTAAISVFNQLNIGAGFTVNVATPPAWVTGQTYSLIQYSTLSGSIDDVTTGTIPGLGARQTATLGNSGSAITLTIAGDAPVWTGLASGAWTTATIGSPKNWKLQIGGTATDFVANDQVLFNDSAAGTTSVNITSADVHVASVLFNNSTKDYTVSSSGGFGIVDGSGAAGLTKNGSGTVTLLTTNSYTGTTTINDGILRLGNGTTDGDIASSASVVNNAKLVFLRSGSSFTNSNVISSFGEVVKEGPGTQIFTGDNSYSGTTTINAGTLQVGNGGTTGSLGTSTQIVNEGSLVFNRSNDLGVAGAIEGAGSVTQAGTGAVTLSGFNTYSGGTLVNGGTLVVGANDALGSGTVTLAGGALSGATTANSAISNPFVAQTSTSSTLVTNGKNLSLNGNLSGSGNLLRSAIGGAATVFLGGDNSAYTGTFTVDANGSAATRFSAATAGSAAAKWVINQSVSTRASLDFAGGTIQFGSFTGTGFFTSQGPGVNVMEAGALGLNETFSGVLNQGPGSTLAVTKVGSGTWTLTGTNTYTGDTTVNAGVLAVDGDALPNAGKLVINGGKVDPSGATEVVDTLFFGATQKASGTWGATGSGATHIDDAHFTGSGVVSVTNGAVGNTYSDWANANAPGQTMDQDHDNDGVDNGIEYFMGLSGSGFTANPAAVGGTITWPMGATYGGVYGTDYKVQTSDSLAIWNDIAAGSVIVTPGTSVAFTLPTGAGKLFVRLVVNN